MYSKDALIALMKKEFGIFIDPSTIGEETVTLYKEELDAELIPDKYLGILPDPVTIQTYVYNEQSEWIIGIALEEQTNNPLFLVCLKNGQRVYQKLFG